MVGVLDGTDDGTWGDCVGDADEEGMFRNVGGDEMDGGADPTKLGGDDGVIVGKLEGGALVCTVGVAEGMADGGTEGIDVGCPVGPGVGDEEGSSDDGSTRIPP